MDGPFYRDSIKPFYTPVPSSVTLTAAYQPIWPNGALPYFPPNYFWPGKRLRCRQFGQYTTGATPGAYFTGWYWGNNTAANGTLIFGGGITATASISADSWLYDAYFTCRAVGTGGSLFMSALVFYGGNGLALQPFSTPGGGTFDTTVANYISPQFYRSGSTAETIQGVDIFWEALN